MSQRTLPPPPGVLVGVRGLLPLKSVDEQTNTVTFTINDAVSQNALDNGMDFRIACSGPGDVSVRWVRVVRMDPPQ